MRRYISGNPTFSGGGGGGIVYTPGNDLELSGTTFSLKDTIDVKDITAVDISGLGLYNLSGNGILINNSGFVGINLSGATLEHHLDVSGNVRITGDLTVSGDNISGNTIYASTQFVGDLSGDNISGVNITATDISSNHIYGTNISGVNISGNHIYGTNISGVNISGEHIYGTNISGINISGEHIYGTTISGGTITATQFVGDLSGNVDWTVAVTDKTIHISNLDTGGGDGDLLKVGSADITADQFIKMKANGDVVGVSSGRQADRLLKVGDVAISDNAFLKMNLDVVEGRTTSQVREDLSLEDDDIHEIINTLVSPTLPLTSTYDDANNTLTLSVNTGNSNGALLKIKDNTTLSHATDQFIKIDDTGKVITAVPIKLSAEEVHEIVNTLVSATPPLVSTYDDANDTLTLSVNTGKDATELLKVGDAAISDNAFLKMNLEVVEGRTTTEVREDLSLKDEDIHEIINTLVSATLPLTSTYDDANDTLTLAVETGGGDGDLLKVGSADITGGQFIKMGADGNVVGVSGGLTDENFTATFKTKLTNIATTVVATSGGHVGFRPTNESGQQFFIGGVTANYRKVTLSAAGTGGDEQIYFVLNGNYKSFHSIGSDSRIKLNQTEYPIEDSMNIVRSIKVKKYYNTDLKREVKGFIAQEVEQILPEAVETHDLSEFGKFSDFKMLNYRRLQVHSFGAIQYLEQKILALEQRILELENRN